MKRTLLLSMLLTYFVGASAQGTWSVKANITTARWGAFGFGIGTKGYIGGGETNSGYLKDFWEYDPSTNVWTQKADYTTTANARSHGIGFSIGSKGYTGLGKASGTTMFSDFKEYDPSNNTWTAKATFPGGTRQDAIGIGTSTSGYVGTGRDALAAIKSDFWQYNPTSNTWTAKTNYGGGGRFYATGFAIGNKVYVGTGNDGNTKTQDFYEYDSTANNWTQKANVGGVARDWAVGFSIGSYGFIGAGTDNLYAAISTFYRYNPASNSWSSIAGLNQGQGAVAFNIGNKGYCGTGFNVNGLNTFYEYDACGSLTFTITKTNVSCNGGSNGTIMVNATGGITPYQYSIDSGATFYSSNAFTNLVANTYKVIVKDTNNCITNFTASIVTQPTVLSFTATNTNVSCNGGNNGSITVTATGGTTPYQYSKNNGSTFQSSNTFSNLAFGTFDVLVKDANNCVTSSQTISITQPTAVSFTTTSSNVICNGGNTGSITVSPSGGISPYQYSKNNGSTFQSLNTFSNLIAATYPIVVKDTNNCLTTLQNVIITQPNAISFSATTTGVSCNGNSNGSISITGTGGTSPLQYSINGGTTFQSANIFSGLTASTYSVIVKDTNNCLSGSQNIIISQPNLLSFTATPTNVSCNGGSNGIITVSGAGGTTPYQFSNNGGSTFQSSNIFSSLSATTYSIIVKDTNNCITAAQNVTVTEPNVLSFSATQSNVTCNGGNNGSITISATGGTSPFQYSSNGGSSYQSSNIISSLTANSYSVIVKDANNCVTASQNITITEPTAPQTPTITANSQTTFCQGDSVVLSSSSANSYLWSNTATSQSTTIFNSVSVTVTTFDISGCSATSVATVVTVNPLPPTPTITQIGNTLTSSSASGNQWFRNDTIISGATSQNYSASLNGLYSVQVTDGNGCSSTSAPFSFTFTGIQEITAAQNIFVAPNPTNGKFKLQFGQMQPVEIKIYNNIGAIIYQTKNFTTDIDLSNQPKGNYFILIQTSETTLSKKLIIQ